MQTSIAAMTIILSLTQSTQKPTETKHLKGPAGLKGWTLLSSISGLGDGQYPTELVIVRRGHVVRRISERPFVWRWMFLPDGKRVAYEEGPLHFSLDCFLEDIDSGRVLSTYDCYHDPLGERAPEWVQHLESQPN